jgi:alanine racemase
MHKPPLSRQSWIEIDLGALKFNVKQLKGRLKNRTKLMAVIKADGYGHGAVAVANAALTSGAQWLGVATVPEAAELRSAGIVAPIMLLSQAPATAIENIIELGITPLLSDPEFAYRLAGAAQLTGKTVGYHLKIDTGMNRLGVDPAEAVSILRELAKLPHLRLEGVATHFATADVAKDRDAAAQLRLFEQTLGAIRDAGIDPGIVHAANSAATILIPDAHFDMVRCGLAIYGLHPGDDTRALITLKPVMSVYTQAELVHEIEAGAGVSYGMDWRADVACAVVTLPIGYADRVPRIASGALELLHDGRRFDQVGRITMDQLMVKAMRGERIEAGSTFVIIGTDGEQTISMDEIAQKAETITHEIACGLGRRLERIYI